MFFSRCLYKLGHITRPIIKIKVIDHAYQEDNSYSEHSLSKTQLIVRTKCSCCCHLRDTYVKTKTNVLWKQCKS